MNIASLNNSNLVSTSAIAAQTSQASVSNSVAGVGGGAATVSAISPAAGMLAKLSALKSSDPEQFQATMKKMADGLRTAAKEHTGESAKFLSGLADKVTEAAQTGDLSVLNPPTRGAGVSSSKGSAGPRPNGPPPGGGGPPPGAGGASTSSKKAVSTDPADTNGDGTVSAAEAAIYALTHPGASAAVSGTSSSSST